MRWVHCEVQNGFWPQVRQPFKQLNQLARVLLLVKTAAGRIRFLVMEFHPGARVGINLSVKQLVILHIQCWNCGLLMLLCRCQECLVAVELIQKDWCRGGISQQYCMSFNHYYKRLAVAHRCHTYSAEGVVFVLGDCVQWQVIAALCFAFCHPLLIVRTAAFPPSLLLQPLW